MCTSLVLFASIIISWPIWSTKNPLPQPLSGSGCAAVSDTIYVIGGRDSPGNRYATNYEYYPGSDTWMVKTSMTAPRAHLGCATVDGKIYAIGGWVGNTATGVVEEYDPATDIWTTKSPMPTPRYSFGIASVAGKIYVIGGMNAQGQVFNTVEEYNPVTDTWQTKTSMPTPRMGPGCAALNDTIYVYGGSMAVGSGLTTAHECYDPITDNWSARTSMPTGIFALGGFAWGTLVCAIGGYNYSYYIDDLEAYDIVTSTWNGLTPMTYARQSSTVACIGYIVYYAYVIGGWNNGALDYNEEAWFELGIEEYTNKQPPITISVSPNPFSKLTKIRYSVFDTGYWIHNPTINIYDASGRLVKSFYQESGIENQESGIIWNGRDDHDKQLPNGAYLLVLNNSEITTMEKLLLVR